MHCKKSGCAFSELRLAIGAPNSRFRATSKIKAKATQNTEAKLHWCLSKWENAKPIDGTKGEAYFRARGITCDLPTCLRWMPHAYHKPTEARGTAIIARVEPTGAVHRTFFNQRGNRMTKSPKMMFGPCSGGAVRLSNDAGTLVVCEGIETGLSLLSGLLSGSAAVWAALSTAGMCRLQLPDKPARLVLATDGDKAGRQAGKRLASRARDLGWDVSFLNAPDGYDWNDVLQKKVTRTHV